MSHVSFRRLASCALAVALACFASLSPADEPSHPWRIAVNGGADDHGEIVFAFAEEGVDVTEIAAAIPKGTPENDVARRVRRALRHALPADQYGVDVSGGEMILVWARGHARSHEIRLVRNTVPGAEVSVVRE